ncbi:unnamed protein product [Sphagnum balticum]
MEVDISEPKSRSFNIFLRFFQLGLALVIGILISKLDQTNCNDQFYGLISIVGSVLIGINLLAMVYLRCREAFPKVAFFVVFIADLILAGIFLVISFAGVG